MKNLLTHGKLKKETNKLMDRKTLKTNNKQKEKPTD